MATASNGTLVYTTQQRAFNFTEGSYVLSGTKICNAEGVITSVENGNVNKDGAYVGAYYVRYEDGQAKVNVNNMTLAEMTVVLPMINELLTKLAE